MWVVSFIKKHDSTESRRQCTLSYMIQMSRVKMYRYALKLSRTYLQFYTSVSLIRTLMSLKHPRVCIVQVCGRKQMFSTKEKTLTHFLIYKTCQRFGLFPKSAPKGPKIYGYDKLSWESKIQTVLPGNSLEIQKEGTLSHFRDKDVAHFIEGHRTRQKNS